MEKKVTITITGKPDIVDKILNKINDYSTVFVASKLVDIEVKTPKSKGDSKNTNFDSKDVDLDSKNID